MSFQYHLSNDPEAGTANITVYIKGKGNFSAQSDHPYFEKIRDGAIAGDESILDLFDLSQAAGTYFERVSERVTTAYGHLFFDGVEVDNALTRQVLRFLDEGVSDWRPLVNFFENVQQNPNEHSKEQLYDWLTGRDFTITREGMIVGYKGVGSDGNGGYQSCSTGTAIVDGEVFTGHIPNYVGAVVEMPRNQVHHDPGRGCSAGLHVGTYDYAEGYASGAMLEVHVNPRDVVSVPTESHAAKMRVCRYVVSDIIDAPHTSAVVSDYEPEYCENCGDSLEDCWCDFSEPEEPMVDYNLGVKIGDVFTDTDKRRKGRTFTVTGFDGEHAVGNSEDGKKSRVRKVKLDRLVSRKYKRV